jgi:hypothetical protein
MKLPQTMQSTNEYLISSRKSKIGIIQADKKICARVSEDRERRISEAAFSHYLAAYYVDLCGIY